MSHVTYGSGLSWGCDTLGVVVRDSTQFGGSASVRSVLMGWERVTANEVVEGGTDGSVVHPLFDTLATPDVGRTDYELVMVTYRSRRQVVGFLENLDADVPLVIVDNSANVDGVREELAGRANARYIDGGGVGFARAANLGARSSDRDVVVFVNPDGRPHLEDIEALVADVVQDPTLAVCAATPVGADGRSEIGVGGWDPGPARALVHAVGLHKAFPRAGLYAKPDLHEDVDLDWTTGACMAVRREVFENLGGFDETFYVYNEDMAFGHSARAAGLRSRLRTDIPVLHSAGGSGAPNKEMLRLRGASMAMYAQRELNPGAAAVVCGALVAGSTARAAVAAVRRNRPLAQGHWQYALGILTRDASVGGKRIYRSGVRVD